MNANPRSMTIRRPGNVQPSPSGTASKPFWAEMLLEGGDGEMTAMRAHFDPGAISHWHSHPRGQFLYVLWASAAPSAMAARSRRYDPAMRSGSRRARNIGTAPRKTARSVISAFNRERMGGSSIGWKR